jgi:hypothetical protein
MAMNFNIPAQPNRLSDCFGSPPAHDAAGVAAAIAFGAARIGGGAGGSFGGEPRDVPMIDGPLVTPPPRDAFNVNQFSESPGVTPASSLRSDLADSTMGPAPRVSGSDPRQPDALSGLSGTGRE